jgi:hypothetical protein
MAEVFLSDRETAYYKFGGVWLAAFLLIMALRTLSLSFIYLYLYKNTVSNQESIDFSVLTFLVRNAGTIGAALKSL